MDQRRKTLGRRIYRARRKAGYRSQRAFAEAIGVSEASVANAERGSATVGNSVFSAIEDGLNWAEDCIQRYLETGDETLLRQDDQTGRAGHELTTEQLRELLLARLAAVEALHPDIHDRLEERRRTLLERAVRAIPDDQVKDLLSEE